MTHDGERIAALEVRMKHVEDEGAETLRLVTEMHRQMTVSKGAVVGATFILGGVVGVVGFFWKTILDLITGHTVTPPH